MQQRKTNNSVEQVMISYQLNMLSMANNFAQSQQAVMIAFLQYAAACDRARGNSSSGHSATAIGEEFNSFSGDCSSLSTLPTPRSFSNLGGLLPMENVQRAVPEAVAVQAVAGEQAVHVAQAVAVEQAVVERSEALAQSVVEQAVAVEQSEVLLQALSVSQPAHVIQLPSVSAQGACEESTSSAVNTPMNVEDFVEAFVTIVSERTGYPVDMLEPQLDLETDLGVDSIKRIEILSRFRKLLPDDMQTLVEGSMEEVAGVRTIEEISTWIRNVFEGCESKVL